MFSNLAAILSPRKLTLNEGVVVGWRGEKSQGHLSVIVISRIQEALKIHEAEKKEGV